LLCFSSSSPFPYGFNVPAHPSKSILGFALTDANGTPTRTTNTTNRENIALLTILTIATKPGRALSAAGLDKNLSVQRHGTLFSVTPF
jgi:hypothetical protein